MNQTPERIFHYILHKVLCRDYFPEIIFNLPFKNSECYCVVVSNPLLIYVLKINRDKIYMHLN